jgi:hypothetical protein
MAAAGAMSAAASALVGLSVNDPIHETKLKAVKVALPRKQLARRQLAQRRNLSRRKLFARQRTRWTPEPLQKHVQALQQEQQSC